MAFVLAQRRDWLTRDQIVAVLWPDDAGAAARRDLRKLLFRARAKPWLGALEARADALRWLVDSDVQAFESCCARQAWAQAVAAYEGVLCEGFEQRAAQPFVEWLRFERNRLTALYRAAAGRRLVELADDAAAREALARQWLAFDPLDEDALVAWVAALHACRRAADAQRAIGDHTRRFADHVGVEPSARVRALAGGPAAP